MFEQPTDSINGTFRHQQSEQLSHAWEPCEFPLQKSQPFRPLGSGLPGRTKTVPVNRLPLQARSGQLLQSRFSKTTDRPAATDELGLYLNDALKTPLLTKENEQQLAQQIFLYRQAFQRLVLKEPDVIQHLVNLLSRWESKQARIDTICNLGLSELAKRNELEPKIRQNLKLLRRLPRRIRSATTSTTASQLHKKTIRLVEELLIRPQPFETAPFQNPKAHELLGKYRKLCQHMTQANMRLVVQIAKQICGNSSALIDMIQEGNRGLMHAVTKFDHRCNVRFSTYATPWIKQAIFGSLANSQRNIRVPENFRAISRKVQRRVNDIRNGQFEFLDSDSGKTIALIADELDMSASDVERHLRIQRDTCSLNQPASGPGAGADSCSNLGDALPDHRCTDPLELAQRHEREQFVRSAMRQTLTRRESDVISLRFGFKDGQDRSFAEVGRVMGLTRQRVCQVEKQALEKLGNVTSRLGLETSS